MKILVTGGAGFIGSALSARLFKEGHEVVIVDNFNEYYDSKLKRDRVAQLLPNVPVYFLDITNKEALNALFATYGEVRHQDRTTDGASCTHRCRLQSYS